MNRFRCTAIVALALCLTSVTRADEDQDKQIAELKAKVASLEKRVAALEQILAPMKAEAQKKGLRELFEARSAQDAKKYKPEQLREAEQLYQTMNKNWRSDDGKAALKQLIEKYPDLNRTGCAVLYLGQVSQSGDEKEKYLQEAIDEHSDCMYGDGVQVGAYARYLLALHYKEKGNNGKAASLFDEIRKDYPFAVDHKGRALVDQMQ
jgi:DNA repair exonuclease SbcCD ATPase subunit